MGLFSKPSNVYVFINSNLDSYLYQQGLSEMSVADYTLSVSVSVYVSGRLHI